MSESGEKHMMLSSFGRRQDKYMRRTFGSIESSGYRRVIKVGPNCNLRVNVAVHYLFNDPELLQWMEGDTIDHIDNRMEYKSNDFYWMLRRASRREQALNRTMSAKTKESLVIKQCVGRVQAREWKGCIVGTSGPSARPKGGTPDDWDNSMWWYGLASAARNTGYTDASKLTKWINDGKPHLCKQSGKVWEFRLLTALDEDGYDFEQWYKPDASHHCSAWWPGDLWVSNFGRYKWGESGTHCMPSKCGVYRTVCIQRFNWKYHELVGWFLFGVRPSEQHTIDHDDKALDDDGCLSNKWTNLLGWADRKQQASTKDISSKAVDIEKKCFLRVKLTGSTICFNNVEAAAVYANVSKQSVRDWASGRHCSSQYEAWYADNTDLVYVRVDFKSGKLNLKLEVEQWKELRLDQWTHGGKYNKVLFGEYKRKKISDCVVSTSNDLKRKRPNMERHSPSV